MIPSIFTGILSGMGIGGGTLLLLWLTLFGGFEQTQAQLINLLCFIPCASFALFSHVKNKMISKKAVFPAVIAGVLVSPVSAYFATGLDMEVLKKIFGIFLIFVGISELFKKCN